SSSLFFTAEAEAENTEAENTEAENTEAENTETRGNIQNIPFSHKKYMLLAKYHTKKLFTTETKTNGYHTLHYHHSNFTTILPSVSLFLPFSVTEIRFRDPKGKSMP
ncbi:TPA: hypothetical protein IOI41_004748, partial [Salmonella enterica]